ILDAVLAVACGVLLGILARSAGASAPAAPRTSDSPASVEERRGPFLRAIDRTPAELPALAALQKHFGFVPRLYRSQTLRPDAVEAEVQVLEALVFGSTGLARPLKESLIVAASAANRNTYCATLHGRSLQLTGVAPEAIDRIADDPAASDLPDADR